MKLPKIRENLLVQDLENEALIYDLTTNRSFCLNETAKTVFNACDGEKAIADVNLPEDVIYLSLDVLQKNNLLVDYARNHFAEMNRREVIRKVGLASMIALPMISSLVVPTATMAQSVAANCQTCTANTDCASGRCRQNALGGSNLCAVNTDSVTYPLGTGFGATDSQCVNIVGPSFCCSGRASKASGVCRCE